MHEFDMYRHALHMQIKHMMQQQTIFARPHHSGNKNISTATLRKQAAPNLVASRFGMGKGREGGKSMVTLAVKE